MKLVAQLAGATDLLDVFSTLNGSALFQGLTAAAGGQPSVLGRIGWIFTGFGAAFVLWGFVLRSRDTHGREKLGEAVRAWVVLAAMLGGPVGMKAAMESADGIYATAVGSPQNLTLACVKAAYALPELSSLFDLLRRQGAAGAPAAAPAAGGAGLVDTANDGSVLGYLEAFGAAVWDTASDYAASAAQTWRGLVRLLTLLTGFGSAMLKCALIILTVLPLYFLLLASAAIIWFMVQLRYFLAVTGTMMLPLFVGMLALPDGHPSRAAGHAYVMNLISLALWPVAWTIGHTGTVALYDALMALVAGTSRVSAISDVLQWSAITGGAGPTAVQVQTLETALGNWFMGNVTALLALLVGGLGFVLWVVVVSVMGPVFLHKVLATGALFMSQAALAAGRASATSLRVGAGAAPTVAGAAGLLRAEPGGGGALAAAAAGAVLGPSPGGPAPGTAVTMARAAASTVARARSGPA